MKIVLCAELTTIRERWFSILSEKQYSLYLAASTQMLNSIVHKNDKYLLMMHKPFAEPESISMFCRNSMFRVFVLSDSPSTQEGIMFLQFGAAGYANSYIAPNRLCEAIKTIEEGGSWFEYQLISTLIGALKKGKSTPPADTFSAMPEVLSQREKEIAYLVSQGLSNQAIAAKLFISERTVKAHLGTIFSKTGTQSRLQLALLVLDKKH